MLPGCTVVEPEIVRGITFQVEQCERVLLAHCSVGDRNSGIVFGIVEEDDGGGRPQLRKNLELHLEEITEWMTEETGHVPDLVCLGSTPEKELPPVEEW